MIYLVLDTNIWLYMANGFDSISEQIDVGSDNHMLVFQQLKSKTDAGEFKILVNDIILNEWVRNKDKAFLHIKHLKDLKSVEIKSLMAMKGDLEDEEFKSKCAAINSRFDQEIAKNQAHISEVENFLHECESIEVSKDVKLEIAELAINKEKAPFKTDKNNCADAAILFSSVDYLTEHMKDHIEKAVFVSNNYREFGESKDSNKFHHDLVPRIGNLSIDFHRHFTNLLELAEDLQYEIDYFHELIRDSNQFFNCISPYCESQNEIYGFGYLEEDVRVANNEEFVNPDQMKLFEFEPSTTKSKIVQTGYCVVCSSQHIQCPSCDSLLIDINNGGQYYCQDCESYFQMDISPVHQDKIIFPIKEDQFHL